MLALIDLRKVAWRRAGATTHYLGYMALGDESIRLSGRESGTGIDVGLSIPHGAIRSVHIGSGDEEQLVGEPAIVLELADRVPIFVRPVGTGALDTETLGRRLAAAVADYSASRPCASA
jgi:hypothetical protein